MARRPNRVRITSITRRTGFILLLLIAVVAGGLYQVGVFLAPEDRLQQADAIFVFAGTRVERPLEAADLFRARYAPRIVLTRGAAESHAIQTAAARGVVLPDDVAATVEMLRKLGVPDSAVIVPPRLHDSTADEARTLRDLALEQRWRRVIVVSSPYHLRRAGMVTRRALADTGVQIVRHASRYDRSTPPRWWRRRADIKWVVSEVPKLIAYTVGVGT